MKSELVRQTGSLGSNLKEYRDGANSLCRPWSQPAGNSRACALTCDVEDYFQVSAFEHLVPKDSWSSYECRIPRNVDRILELLSDSNAKATFFTLAWVATEFPELIRRIAAEGHEIASHGMNHTRIWAQSKSEFSDDISTSKRILEDVSGVPVRGYRAASWSLDDRSPWAHDEISRAGFEYTSSLYPVTHDHYGVPNAPRHPFYPTSGDILEVPASTARILGRNVPAAGGGYFRLYPLQVSLWMIRRIRKTGDAPYIFYFHPWELDVKQPRISGADAKSRFRHYLNLHKFEKRLMALLSNFEWGRMDDIFLPKTG